MAGNVTLNQEDNENYRIPDAPKGKSLFFSANVNGLRGKFNVVSGTLLTYKPSVFAIQETKINSGHKNSEFAVEGYDFFRRDRVNSQCGGGVALYVRSDLMPRKLAPRRTPAGLELVAV